MKDESRCIGGRERGIEEKYRMMRIKKKSRAGNRRRKKIDNKREA